MIILKNNLNIFERCLEILKPALMLGEVAFFVDKAARYYLIIVVSNA